MWETILGAILLIWFFAWLIRKAILAGWFAFAAASAAKDKVESEKQHASSARDNWLKMQDTADRESGRAGSLPDPLAHKS